MSYIETHTTALQPSNSIFSNRLYTGAERKDTEDRSRLVIVEDIKDISFSVSKLDFLKQDVLKPLSFFGVTPVPRLTEDFAKKGFFSLIIAGFLNVYTSYSFLYSAYFLSTIITFGVYVFFDKESDINSKIKTLVSEILFAGFAVVLAQLILSSIFQLPFVNFTIPIVSIVLPFLILGQIRQLGKLLLPYTFFAKSKTLKCLALSVKDGFNSFSDNFQRRMIDPTDDD